MQKFLIELPSIRDDDNGYKYLFRLAQEIIQDPRRYFDFNFKNCAVLDQNAVAMLGGLARYVDCQNTIENKGLFGLLVPEVMIPRCGVMFQVDTMSQLISKQLIDNNFLSHFTSENFEGYPDGDYIGYRQHLDYLDSSEIALHLNDKWLSDEKITFSDDLKEAVVSRIIEIFMNAYGHSFYEDRRIFVSCGQYFKKEKKIKLSVLDFGRGIIENVKSHLQSDISDEDAMKWALRTGNSTKTDSINDDIPRGLGFGLLSEFTTVNGGELRIFSNSCEASAVGSDKYSVTTMKTPFKGTLVTISINCDGRHYRFMSEDDNATQYF